MQMFVLLSMTQSSILGEVVDKAARLSLESFLPRMLSRDVVEFLDAGVWSCLKRTCHFPFQLIINLQSANIHIHCLLNFAAYPIHDNVYANETEFLETTMSFY